MERYRCRRSCKTWRDHKHFGRGSDLRLRVSKYLVSMNAPLGIECQLQLTSQIVLRRDFESGNKPALVLHEGIQLEIGPDPPQQVRAGVTLCSTSGQEQRTGFHVAIAYLDTCSG